MITATSAVATTFFTEATEIHLPFGLIGLRHLRQFRIAPIVESWPFLEMRPKDEEAYRFLAIEPIGVIADYPLKVSDQDAEALGIESSEDAVILNLVTVHSLEPQFVTANLAGPILINVRSLMGMQIIPDNSHRYSTSYPLIDERPRVSAA